MYVGRKGSSCRFSSRSADTRPVLTGYNNFGLKCSIPVETGDTSITAMNQGAKSAANGRTGRSMHGPAPAQGGDCHDVLPAVVALAAELLGLK